MEDQKEGVRKQQAEVTKLNAVIRDMEKDIIVLKKEIQERDDTIQDKVCHIYPFTSTNLHYSPSVHLLRQQSKTSILTLFPLIDYFYKPL